MVDGAAVILLMLLQQLAERLALVLRLGRIEFRIFDKDWTQYADYRQVGMPIGSGVTEAACKTVFT